MSPTGLLHKEEKNGFTFTWKIENYDMSPLSDVEYFTSPKFLIQNINNSQWQINFFPKTENVRPRNQKVIECIGITVVKLDDSRKRTVGISLHLLTPNGPYFLFKENRRNFFLHGYMYKFFKDLKHETIIRDTSRFLQDNALILRCHFWTDETANEPSVSCSAVTRIGVERHIFHWPIKDFGAIPLGQYLSHITPLMSNDTTNFEIKFCLFEKEFFFENLITNPKEGKLYMVRSRISIINNNGDLSETSKNYTLLQPKIDSWKFALKFTINELKVNREFYLPKDVLTLHCEFSVATNDFFSWIEECNFVTGFPKCWAHPPKRNESFQACSSSNTLAKEKISSLNDDLFSLLLEKKFCDVILKSNNKKEFPAHKIILSSRSPVFSRMFQSDMKEKKTGVVHIEDVNSETLEPLLTFLYFDKVHISNWEVAISLYQAADKYQILALKQKCSSYLTSNLSPENVCDILSLSHVYQDEDLKCVSQKLFCTESKSVLLSEKWTMLLQRIPDVAADTLRVMAKQMN